MFDVSKFHIHRIAVANVRVEEPEAKPATAIDETIFELPCAAYNCNGCQFERVKRKCNELAHATKSTTRNGKKGTEFPKICNNNRVLNEKDVGELPITALEAAVIHGEWVAVGWCGRDRRSEDRTIDGEEEEKCVHEFGWVQSI